MVALALVLLGLLNGAPGAALPNQALRRAKGPTPARIAQIAVLEQDMVSYSVTPPDYQESDSSGFLYYSDSSLSDTTKDPVLQLSPSPLSSSRGRAASPSLLSAHGRRLDKRHPLVPQ